MFKRFLCHEISYSRPKPLMDSADKSDKVELKEKKEEKSPKDDNKERDRSDRGERSHPPAKRLRDDQRDNRYNNNDRYYDMRSGGAPRGREFVRGARSRGRGRGIRGASISDRSFGRGGRGRRGGGGRDYRSYDNHMDYKSDNRGSRQSGPSYADQARPFSIAKWNGEENERQQQEEVEEVSKRLRDKDEESDVSADELSGSFSESSVEKGESRENSEPKEKEVKDDKKNRYESRPKRDDYRDNYYNADQRNDYQHRGYHREDSYRGRGGFTPRGEPSRHGRGRGKL